MSRWGAQVHPREDGWRVELLLLWGDILAPNGVGHMLAGRHVGRTGRLVIGGVLWLVRHGSTETHRAQEVLL